MLQVVLWGSGRGSVGRAVASDTRDPRFESQHRQNFIYQLYIEIEKRPGMLPGINNGTTICGYGMLLKTR